MCAIEIMEPILGSTTLVVNRYNNISALRKATIHPEAVKFISKQVYLISHLSDVYQSIDSGVSLVHIYVHHNSGKTVSTLTPLAYLNVRLNALAEHIMASFILSSATRSTIAIVILDPHVLTSVSINGASVHFNIAQSVAYEISKLLILQHWYNRNLTHMSNWG